MTQQEINQLKGLMVMYAGYYRQQFSDATFEMYAEDLSNLDFHQVTGALLAYRKNPKNKTFPLPAVIIEMLNPTLDDTAVAQETVSRICQAITNIGRYRTDEAKEHLGELAWQVVRANGGWSMLCESDFMTNTNAKSQAREYAKAIMDLSRKGKLGEAFALPAPERFELPQFKSLTETIEYKKPTT